MPLCNISFWPFVKTITSLYIIHNILLLCFRYKVTDRVVFIDIKYLFTWRYENNEYFWKNHDTIFRLLHLIPPWLLSKRYFMKNQWYRLVLRKIYYVCLAANLSGIWLCMLKKISSREIKHWTHFCWKDCEFHANFGENWTNNSLKLIYLPFLKYLDPPLYIVSVLRYNLMSPSCFYTRIYVSL